MGESKGVARLVVAVTCGVYETYQQYLIVENNDLLLYDLLRHMQAKIICFQHGNMSC